MSDVTSRSTDNPVVLTVQQVFDRPLEVTAQKLESLRESQQALMSLLTVLTTRLQQFQDDTQPVDITDTITKIVRGRKRLIAINATLVQVQERLVKVKERLSA